nr:flagellar biosynthetic protein FliO [uncultured Rhodopila sp.]
MTGQTASLMGVALIAILALIGLSARVLQPGGWRPASGTGRTLVVRETIALDPRRRLHLVQCADRQVILLTGGGQDLVVGWITDR